MDKRSKIKEISTTTGAEHISCSEKCLNKKIKYHSETLIAINESISLINEIIYVILERLNKLEKHE